MEADNILARMPELEARADQYFIHRPLAAQPDYEEHYWNVVVDPDGNTRDRLSERERFLANVTHEVHFLHSLTPGRILDIGCGLGFLLSAMDDRWMRHGVELSAFAAKYAQDYGHIFVGDVSEACYPNEHFDVIVMHHVIEHIPDPTATIKEVLRILKPGGHLVLGTPDFDSGCARLFGSKYRLLHDPTHVSLFSNDSMHRFLRDHGFVIDKVDYPYFDTPYFTPDNLTRLFDTAQISPPFYGNFMTFYCHKPDRKASQQTLWDMGRAAETLAGQMDGEIERAGEVLQSVLKHGNLLVWGDEICRATLPRFVAGLAVEDRARTVCGAVAVNEGNPTGLLAVAADGNSAELRELLSAAQIRGLRIVALLGNPSATVREDVEVCIGVQDSDKRRIRNLQAALLDCLSDQLNPRTAVDVA